MKSKEVIEKGLALAKKALENNKICFVPTAAGLVEEFTTLQIDGAEEIRFLLIDLFKEIKADDYLHIKNPTPNPNFPEFNLILNFVWQSKKLRRKMQIQFAVNDECFCYYSLSPTYNK